ncbi:MAG: VWA domain-containing protein [Acidobacteria bacterium]|nr:VWA domain-containing protein [Acidobacteriota bacterium]
MHIQSDRALIPSGSSSTRFLSVTISAPAAPAPATDSPGTARAARPGVNVSLVLDRSGSMGGRKIELAREAVGYAIRLLKEDDRLGLVVYDHVVDTLLECVPATKAAKAQALGALAAIDARGQTNLAEGWLTGARSLGGPPATIAGTGPAAGDRLSRVLLLTDGLANQGMTDHDELRQAAARLRAEGVQTSTFGLGADFDEELLSSIASEGGGHFYFIEQPQQIPDLLASELGEVLEVAARDVVFEVCGGAGVSVAVLNPLPVAPIGQVTRVRLGDLVAEQDVTLLLAVTCEARAEGERAWVDCRVADREAVLHHEPMRVEWTAVGAEADRAQPVNRDVVLAVARMLAEGARVQALAANRRGEFRDAGAALHDAAAQIDRLGGDDTAVQAIARLLVDEERVFARRMDPMERKARHFASYQVAYSREEGKARKRRG